MLVFKKKHISKGYTKGLEWVILNSNGEYEEYIGPIIRYGTTGYGDTKFNSTVLYEKELFPYRNYSNLIYDALKPEYKGNFKEPVPVLHVLTEKEIEKGKYSRYFAYYDYSVIEIGKKGYKYIGKNSTPYHKTVPIVEVKMELSSHTVGLNMAEINKAKLIIPGIVKLISPDDYIKNPIYPNNDSPYRPDIKLPK